MAEATKTVVETVTLRLSKEEAETLVALLNKVGGSSKARTILNEGDKSVAGALASQVGWDHYLSHPTKYVALDLDGHSLVHEFNAPSIRGKRND